MSNPTVATLDPDTQRLTKPCSRCRDHKPIEAFSRDCSRPCGYGPWCKACAKEVRDKSPYKAASLEKMKEWHRNNPVRSAFLRAVKTTKVRHRVATITVDDLVAIYAKQGGKCALTGIAMTSGNVETHGAKPTSMSLDRVIPELGYCVGNVRLVCFAANSFRGTMTDTEMLEMARSLVTTMEARS